MKKLCYSVLKEQGYDGYLLQEAPERILQFGEGNFLRAFVDYFIDIMNEKADFNAKVVLCQPIGTAPAIADMINEQEGLYTLYLRGFESGQKINKKRIISSVSRCINPYKNPEMLWACASNPDLRFIACNTTEAGIVYDPNCNFTDELASSYPGKLTQFLFKRFKAFGSGKGFIILSCELIDDNGKELEKCVLQYAKQWNLSEEFVNWVKTENTFCSTLVDRIVTGYPSSEAEAICKENGYLDNLIDTGEIFAFWVIEGPRSIKDELPFEKAGLPILVTENHKPYKQRKVRILNGAHTSMVLGAYLAGQNIVRNCMQDDTIREFMEKTIYHEIIPTLTLPENELIEFANSVAERFNNPFIDHSLLAISLNSTSKWRARVMPSFKEYIRTTGKLPVCITASFAFYLAFYRGSRLEDSSLIGLRDNKEYEIKDDPAILQFYLSHKEDSIESLVHAVCTNTDFWGEDFTEIPGFEQTLIRYLTEIEQNGTYELMKKCLSANC